MSSRVWIQKQNYVIFNSTTHKMRNEIVVCQREMRKRKFKIKDWNFDEKYKLFHTQNWNFLNVICDNNDDGGWILYILINEF